MTTSIRHLPLLGFHGLDSNRGPVRCEHSISDEAVQQYRQEEWIRLRNGLPVLLGKGWPNSREEIDIEALRQNLCPNDEEGPAKNCFIFLTDDGSYAREIMSMSKQGAWKVACHMFDRYAVLKALLPVANIVSGIVKIVLGISKDGSALGVIPEDRWKFKATLIAVGIAEICFLGLIVHGVASLYFAMTSPEPQLSLV